MNHSHGDNAFDFLSDSDGPGGGAVAAPRSGRMQPDFSFEPDSEGGPFDPPEDIQARVARVLAAQNPLQEAAQPLLRMLADMPASLDSQAAVERLRALLVREVVVFQKLCDKANLPWKHMAAVRYCLCTALDEAANRTRWGGGGIWAAKSLLITFEGEVDGGEKFFLLIGRMATDPQAYVDVLEVLYRILGLGFEGRYSVVVEGRRHLEQIRQRLLTLISGARDPVQLELSPHWRGVAPGKMRLLNGLPVWATASVAALLVFGLFAWYKYHLLYDGNALEARILAIGQQPPMPPSPPPVRKPLRLSVLLKDEIARGLVSVDEDDKHSHVVFSGDYMFVPGSSNVRPEIDPVLARVAQEVARVGGNVTVTGHSDNQPIRTAEFPDNQALSEKRAAFVAQVLASYGTPAVRIRSVGVGDKQPLADDATAAGRSRNRRVEILVTQ
ncbi:type VI secretion system protein ImpK [Paraburkholderia caballeronis]|uniref:type VI secretion system protein TssL, long form n=1 Tax=Paraburkholderia caballeronis TaxID=416943 RepID=UPI001066A51A|nr:type VI secretion system protein TssL, long form [Paraburkholderia caballeronis]TDV35644.1 type VI secretion system protein ImpK [Paraburkholderia caballeronis]